MSFKIKDNLSRDQIADLVEALRPFYGFGSVIGTASHENGTATVILYNGKPPPEDGFIERSEEGEIDLTETPHDGCIIGAVASWYRSPAVYSTPVIQAGDFFKARDAFLSCIDDDQGADETPPRP